METKNKLVDLDLESCRQLIEYLLNEIPGYSNVDFSKWSVSELEKLKLNVDKLSNQFKR